MYLDNDRERERGTRDVKINKIREIHRGDRKKK